MHSRTMSCRRSRAERSKYKYGVQYGLWSERVCSTDGYDGTKFASGNNNPAEPVGETEKDIRFRDETRRAFTLPPPRIIIVAAVAIFVFFEAYARAQKNTLLRVFINETLNEFFGRARAMK